jgi:TnpA family transposase
LTVEDVVRRVKGVKGIAQEIEVRPAISNRTADDEIATCPSFWGNGTTSSSDGQFFQASDRAANHGDVNLHHGSEPGSKFHSHLSPISTATQHSAHQSDRKRGC